MIYLAFAITMILVVVTNIYSYCSNHIAGTDYISQRIALNRLKHPRLNGSSEWGSYPKLHKNVQLIAIRKANKLYVIQNKKIIYVINAKINLHPSKFQINGARGEHDLHVQNGERSIANSWLNFGKLGYIESPMTIDGQKVHGNWLNNSKSLNNTIEISRPDAHWLQGVPKGTTLIIK